MNRLLIIFSFALVSFSANAQQYLGMSGGIKAPTATMNNAGDVRIGGHFVNREMLPDAGVFTKNGNKYHTGSFYLSATIFKWIEVGYNIVLMKRIHYYSPGTGQRYEGDGFAEKDQFFSVKLSPIQEKDGKWWPSIAIGGSDFFDSHNGNEMYFGHVYGVVTKTFKFYDNTWRDTHELEVSLGYIKYLKSYNNLQSGFSLNVGYRIPNIHELRLMAEVTGVDIHPKMWKDQVKFTIGADYLIWNHFLLQASLQNFKYPSVGLCYEVNLKGVKKYFKEKSKKNKR